ncbi:hypothetical protein N7471_002836 [Penicillium samsonianum]|uniref:uncharacterized protein n=1 Tax=Penicillium samsonianum TaxID=1882272 RepID=UPI0025484A16|nr:uncharacterized protein N7471_002836 [Penicillium samsonianum]KAJ6143383.1 hypothetical protein N7471_002836 [Penicillium samsonianum]
MPLRTVELPNAARETVDITERTYISPLHVDYPVPRRSARLQLVFVDYLSHHYSTLTNDSPIRAKHVVKHQASRKGRHPSRQSVENSLLPLVLR